MRTLIILIVVAISLGSLEATPVKLQGNDEEFQSILSSANELSDFSKAGDANLTVPEIIAKYGYPVEIHHVTTADGYILELHRIPYGKKCGIGGQRRVAFVQHGLLCDSSNWVIAGEERSLAYLLADECYDVWLGNARGNTYSRKHVVFSPDDDKEAFWSYSWNEMGIYDLPANIDYVLAQTGAEKIYYTGHSMGTTMFWICMAERPEYNDKIAIMNALAPVAYTEHMISPIRLIAPFSTQIEWLLEMFGLYEFLPSSAFLEFVGQIFCKENNPISVVCSNILFLLGGYDVDQLDAALLPEILGHLPAGASVPTVVHYAQGVTSGLFRKYNFGKEKNLQVYGQEDPPEYDWSKVTAPIALYWGENDWLGAKADTYRIAENLPNVQRKYRINHDKFSHLDFIFAKDMRTLVNDPVIEFMKNF